MPAPAGGYPVVLTADATLMAAYPLLFDGMIAASQTTATPAPILRGLLLPAARAREGRALIAPLGLRRIEAALVRDGFSPEQVAVVREADLPAALGPATRVIGVSAGEPGGRGMNSSTMEALAGGRTFPQAALERLLTRLRRLRPAAPQARVALGGPGAWQLAAGEDLRRALGVDHVVRGYAEDNAAALFRALAEGQDLPPLLEGAPPPAERIPALRGAASLGAVETSRGCGLGCAFCTLARVPMQHLPTETILADARTNLAAGQRHLSLLSEDLLRYGARGVQPDPPCALALLRELRALPGVGLLQTDHANLCSVAHWSEAELAELAELMRGPWPSYRPWLNLGVESACGELLVECGAGAKLGGVAPARWGEACAAQVQRLVAAGFFPLLSLVMGLPGETPAHVRETLRWVRELPPVPLAVFPMLYAPLDGSLPPRPADLSRAHWELLQAAYARNFRHVPGLVWRGQGAAGVPLPRRLLMQMLGRAQSVQWSLRLAARRRRAR